jgi:hypothetical protein
VDEVVVEEQTQFKVRVAHTVEVQQRNSPAQ